VLAISSRFDSITFFVDNSPYEPPGYCNCKEYGKSEHKNEQLHIPAFKMPGVIDKEEVYPPWRIMEMVIAWVIRQRKQREDDLILQYDRSGQENNKKDQSDTESHQSGFHSFSLLQGELRKGKILQRIKATVIARSSVFGTGIWLRDKHRFYCIFRIFEPDELSLEAYRRCGERVQPPARCGAQDSASLRSSPAQAGCIGSEQFWKCLYQASQ
jgi:hypothetical protein